MGRVVVMLSVSLDGFFEGPDHDISWHRMSEELHSDVNDVLRGAAGNLNGRRNWELMSGYWPSADEEPDAPEPIRDYAQIWRSTPQHVFSTTLPEVGHGATLHRSIDVVPELVSGDGDFFVGGAALAAALGQRGWVDEYRLHLNPVLLGSGTPLFQAGVPQELALRDTRAYPHGVVQLQYEVVR